MGFYFFSDGARTRRKPLNNGERMSKILTFDSGRMSECSIYYIGSFDQKKRNFQMIKEVLIVLLHASTLLPKHNSSQHLIPYIFEYSVVARSVNVQPVTINFKHAPKLLREEK